MEPDVTQTAVFFKLSTWVATHRKHVLWGVGALVVIALWAGFSYWRQGERQTAANQMLSSLLMQGLMSGKSAPADQVLKVATEYPGTSAAERAQLIAGAGFFGSSKFPEAKVQFEKYLSDHPNGAFASPARLGVAASLDAQGRTNEAIAAYKDISDRHPNDLAVPQAKLALARLFAAQGSLDLALDYYGQIARPEFGSLASEAELRMRELIAQHPNLIQTIAPPTNAPPLMPVRP